jgi:hypothetical protein
MKIALMSSFGERCGVSEYCKNLVNGLFSNNIDVKIVANYPKDNLEPDPPYLKRLFHCPFMTNQFTADVNGILNYTEDCDVFHIQFNTALYYFDWFQELLVKNAKRKIPVILTMHDSGIWQGFDCRLVNHFITHGPTWCTNSVIGMPVTFFDNNPVENYNSLVSFGLGRNNDDIVRSAIKDINVDYTTSYGNRNWLKLPDLVKFIQRNWIISLFYPEVGADVSSSAVMLALGCHRPVIISKTNWFKHIINYSGIYVCENANDLRDIVLYLIDSKNRDSVINEILQRNSQLISDRRTFRDFLHSHIELYRKLIHEK